MADWVTPASYGQERIWLAANADPRSPVYNVASSFEVGTAAGGAVAGGAAPDAERLGQARLGQERLGQALLDLTARHETLRTCLRWDAERGGLMQVVHDAGAVTLEVEFDDAKGLTAEQSAALIDELHEADTRRPFDLAQAPLWRARFVELEPGRWKALFVLHHTVFDSASQPVLLREFTALCEGGARLPELAIQYADYAAWQRGEVETGAIEPELGYWRGQLAGIPAEHAVPTDRPRPRELDHCGDEVVRALPAELTALASATARRLGTTPFTLYLAGCAALLARLSGQRDVVLGVPTSDRDRPELDALIGMLVNAVVVRVDAQGGPGLEELAARTQTAMLDALDHRKVPFQVLAEHLAPRREAGVPPLYQLSFNYVPDSGADSSHGTARADLLFELTNHNLRLEYSTALFDSETVEAIADRYLRLLGALLAEPTKDFTRLELLDEAENELILRTWNRDEAESDMVAAALAGASLHALFEAQAARTPDAVAITAPDGELTYAQLDAAASRLAARLHELGVRVDEPVAVCAERSLAMVVSLLGVLKAGGAYVPMDPEYPAARLAEMLEDCDARVVLVHPGLADLVAGAGAAVRVVPVTVERDGAAAAAGAAVPGESSAYIIYTSGSTGRPKGVPNPHRAVVNRISWMQRRFGLGPDDVVLQKTPYGFDVSVWEFFWPLSVGARLVLAEPGGHRDPVYLRALIESEGVTTLHFVPSMLAVFLEEAAGGARACCPSLRRVVCSGEALSTDVARRALAALPGELWNLYGPTEAAIDVTAWQCLPGNLDGPGVPIGRPISGLRLYVLDEHGRPVPPGVVGELFIGGAGVARGYHRRPALTARRFVPDPFAEVPGSRMYRTGDLARWTRAGVLEFRGRDDHQVKLRGQRIELGEIETALRALPGVRDAAVAVHEPGPYLAAYVVGEADPAGLKPLLAASLPAAMVPGVYVSLDALPLTRNGKLDRKALTPPAGPAGEPGSGPSGAPRTLTEELVAAVWAEVFGRESIGRDEDFFALGGHSLLATKIAVRLSAATGTDVPIRAALAHTTPAALAEHVDALIAGGGSPAGPRPRIRPLAREGTVLPLTHAQDGMWLLQQMDRSDTQLNVPFERRVRGPLDRGAIERALDEVVARHAPLRTRFLTVDGDPTQFVEPDARVAWEHVDLTSVPEAEREAAALRELGARTSVPFDITAAPLLRATLFALAPEDHVMLFISHHLVFDGWSTKIFLDELAAAYNAHTAGLAWEPPRLPIQYADVALHEREHPGYELGEWVERLSGAPVLELPADRRRGAVRATSGVTVAHFLDAQATARLDRIAHGNQCTMYMLLLAAYQAALSAWTGQRDFYVGSPIAARDREELEPIVGLFTNTVVVRADLSGDPSFTELLGRVRRGALEAFAHQDVPFDVLMTRIGSALDRGRTTAVQVLFNHQIRGSDEVPMRGLEVSVFADGEHPVRCDLDFDVYRQPDPAGSGEGMLLRFIFASDLFEAAGREAFARRAVGMLEAVARDPGIRLSELSALGSEERERVLALGAGPRIAGPRRTVPELIASRIAADPGLIAVRQGSAELDYGTLGRRADAIAARLRSLGVGPEQIVGVCLAPGAGLVSSLLGVWGAGGAYLPLSPQYPAARLALLIEDCATRVVLTDRATARYAALPDSVELVYVDELSGHANAGADAQTTPVHPGDLAYVIHTSGSTGRPKGVAVSHGALGARVAWMAEYYGLDVNDRVLQFAAFTFDTHAEEIFPALAAGATLVVPDGPAVALPELLASPAGSDLTVIDLPTPYWHELVASGKAVPWPACLRLAIIGAAQAAGEAVREWHALTGGVRLLNTYGPTEATIVATGADLLPDDTGARPPIGLPFAETTAYVCDESGALVAQGVPGELYLAGAGLARCYLGAPGPTASRFVPDPYGPSGSRRYRTGDAARVRPDGRLEYLGRLDAQIKLRGYRIEPGEIEAQLTALPRVAQAAVVARGETLAAYLVPAAGSAPPPVDEIRAALALQLPAHLIPNAFTVLERLPLTAHGKLDVAALPAPGEVRGGEHVAPRTDAEELVASVWAEVLGVDELSVEADFFDLGGHSLLATRALVRLAAITDLEIPVATIFTHRTAAAMAAEVERLLERAVDALSDEEAERLLAERSGESRT